MPSSTGPLYVIVGQGPGTIIWRTASVIPAPQPCSIQDDFGADASLSPFWTANASPPENILTSVATTLGSDFEPPSVHFGYTQPPGAGMYLDGIKAKNEFTAVQSTDARAGPFTFSATVKAGNNQAGNSFEIDFASQDLTRHYQWKPTWRCRAP